MITITYTDLFQQSEDILRTKLSNKILSRPTLGQNEELFPIYVFAVVVVVTGD